jgi:hypothetical protein
MWTPWGNSQYIERIKPGVFWVTTAGHGGLLVAKAVALRELSPQARALGEECSDYWAFEEDVAWAAPIFEHPEWDNERPGVQEHAKSLLLHYHPEYFTAAYLKRARRQRGRK